MVCTTPRERRKLRADGCAAAVHTSRRQSVSRGGVTASPAPSDSVRRRTSVEGLGVAGDALGRALAGVQDGRVVAAAEGAPDRGQRLRR